MQTKQLARVLFERDHPAVGFEELAPAAQQTWFEYADQVASAWLIGIGSHSYISNERPPEHGLYMPDGRWQRFEKTERRMGF